MTATPPAATLSVDAEYGLRLPDPTQLASASDIHNALRALEAEESQVDEELSVLMGDRALLETLLDRIDGVRPVVELVQLEAEDLAKRVDETADIAERISGKVRQLDLEQSRVSESIEMVQAIQDLKTSLATLATSIDRRDWETATRNIQRALNVDTSISASSFAEAVVPTSDLPLPPLQTISEFRSSLLATFLNEFEKASSSRDEANTSRFFKLFPMIAAETEGLDAYAKFVCSIVSQRNKGALQQQATSPTFFASLLMPLFEQIALIISQHQPVVEKYYGLGKMLPVAAQLQQECDRQANAILAQWEEERRTQRKVTETKRYRYPFLSSLAISAPPQRPDSLLHGVGNVGSVAQKTAVEALKRPYQQLSRQGTQSQLQSGQGQDQNQSQVQNAQAQQTDEDAIDPRAIDAVLNELSQISARWELYRKFLYNRLHTESEDEMPSQRHLLASPELHTGTGTFNLQSTNGNSKGLLPSATIGNDGEDTSLALVETSSFRTNLHSQLQSIYEPLEIWYLRSSIEKAHQLDEPDFFTRPYLSSGLDDTFFILKKVLVRLITTGSIATHRRLASSIRDIMDKDFGDILRKRMDSVWAGISSSSSSALTAQTTKSKEEEKARMGFIVYANDLDTASDYIVRVVDELLESDALSQSYFIESELEMAKASLEGVKALQGTYRTALKSGLDQLFNQLVRPRLRNFLTDCYRDITYLLDEDAYTESDYSNLFQKRFLKAWEVLTDPYRDTFTSENYRVLFTSLIGVLGRLWEMTLKSMKFTELGALRFDRDLRAISNVLGGQTPYGTSILREGFARLQQIGMSLSVEEISDADDLANSNGWKLSQQEMSALLALRV